MQKQTDIIFRDNTFLVSGDLSYANVMSVYEISLKEFTKHPELRIDFSQLKSSDSSGLALVIEWIKFAKRQSKSIKFLNLSADLMSIAKAAGIDEMIAAH